MPKLAVLGQPISHSRSPAMHAAALEELGLAPEWSYEAIEVSPEAFEERVRLMRAEGFAGANVTVPHKVAALAVATSASSAAIQIGAANTLSFTAAGAIAENTDATGIIEALPASPAGMSVLVLGAGGSARAAVWALVQAGARVSVWNRTPERAETLARELGAEVEGAGDGPLPTHEYDLLLNATSVGMEAANSQARSAARETDPASDGTDLKRLRLDADAISARQIVVDLVYGTDETELAAAAQACGATVIDGLEVLVHQGAASLRLWTGMDAPLETMERAARAT